MFYTSFVEPYIEPRQEWRGQYLVKGHVKYYDNGKFVRHGEDVCFGIIHDDDYIDEDKLCASMRGKTVYEAHNAFMAYEED